MKVFIAIVVACLLGILVAWCAFPTNQCNATVDVAKVTGKWDAFRWDWTVSESQSASILLKEGATWLDMTGYFAVFRISMRTSAGQTNYISLASVDCTVAGSNVTFSVAWATVPGAGRYLGELWMWQGTTTNTARVMAQGYIDAHDSLFKTGE